MTLLILGVALFAAVHLFPGIAPARKQALWDKLGEGGYKGLFSLSVLAALVLIVLGWRSATPQFIYLPVIALKPLGLGLVIVALLLFVVSGRPSRLRRVLRHPQLTGVIVWAGAHLLLNGDSRSLVLFGGLGLWALLEILLINRRDGVWIKDEVPGWGTELATLGATAVVVGVLIFVHPWIAGVPVY